MNKLHETRITVTVPDDKWKAMDDDALHAAAELFQDLFQGFEALATQIAEKNGFKIEADY